MRAFIEARIFDIIDTARARISLRHAIANAIVVKAPTPESKCLFTGEIEDKEPGLDVKSYGINLKKKRRW